MSKFKYKGYNSDSNLLTGTLEAENYSAAYSALQFQGVTVVNLTPENDNVTKIFEDYFLKFKLGGRWKAVFFQELSVMLGVMTLHDALNVLKNSSQSHASKKILQELFDDIEGGETFSKSLKRREIIFGDDVIQSVEIGETGGTLQEISSRLAEQIERSYIVKRKVQSAMYYPLVVLIAAFIAALVMINVTLPVFEDFYSEQGRELPFITWALIHGGKFFSENIFSILFSVTAIFFSMLVLYRKNFTVKYFFDKLKFKIKIFREIELRNLFGRLSFLLESGINLDAAIKMTADSSENKFMGKIFSNIYNSVTQGEKLGTVLQKNLKKISPLYLGLIITGEESGELVRMLRQCESMADFEIEEKLRELPAKAEVYGTLTAGIIVGLLVFSVVLPILSMTDFI